LPTCGVKVSARSSSFAGSSRALLASTSIHTGKVI
jgi:hypothetical protein